MLNTFDIKGLGERIRLHRQRIGLTQMALAEKINVSFQAISGWENSVNLPDIENLCNLSTVFGISVDELLRSKSCVDEQFMIGIDGGGTKTEFVLFSSEGKVLKSFRLSGTNASLVGLDATLSILFQGIDICMGEKVNVCGVFAGLAGSKLDVIQQKLSERYPKITIKVNSDGVNAFRSAEGDFALICGTGSILITKDENGYRRIGGWGARMGDPGSAYNFGRAAIRCAYAYDDGISDKPMIYDKLVEMVGKAPIRGSINSSDVPFIASLSSAVFDVHKKGAKEAFEIIDAEMKELADLINKAFKNGGRCVTCGGVMEHNHAVLLPLLKKYLNSDIEFIFPKLPPVYGACVACADEMGIERKDGFENEFVATYQKQYILN